MLMRSGRLQRYKQEVSPDGLGVGCERKGSVKDGCKVGGLNLCRNAGATYWDGKDSGVGS